MLLSRVVTSALVAALVTLGVTSIGATHQQHVIDARSAGLSPDPPPRSAARSAAADPVSVTVGLSLTDVHFDLKIISDERRLVTDEALVTGWMTTEWTDGSLAWSSVTNPDGPTSRPLRLDDDIWVPDIRHLNTINYVADNVLLSESDAVVDPSGNVRVLSHVQFRMRFLPREGFAAFVIRLGSRLMTTAEVSLQPASDSLDMGEYSGWYVTNTWLQRNETTRAGFSEPFSVLEAGIEPVVI